MRRPKSSACVRSLKPQLWSGRLFTGDIVFETDADFEQWFRQYRRWMLHYARLAELYQVDLLAIGTELDGVTHHEAAWRSLIADVHRIYSGPITYSAHWGPDFERLPFWDALDYIGLNMYYPLAAPGEMPRADSPRLKQLVERIGNIARKYDKQLLFTEVGFPSSAKAAAEPWKEDDAALDQNYRNSVTRSSSKPFTASPGLRVSIGGSGRATEIQSPTMAPTILSANPPRMSLHAGTVRETLPNSHMISCPARIGCQSQNPRRQALKKNPPEAVRPRERRLKLWGACPLLGDAAGLPVTAAP